MSKLLGPQETLDWIERLRQTVVHFGRQEDTLRQSWHSRIANETRARESGTQARAAQLEEALATAESDFQTRQQNARQHFEQRRARILAAHKNCRKRALESIQEQENRHRYTLQKRTLDAERQREAALAQADDNLAHFRQTIAESQTRFAQAETSAQSAFAGVGEFRKLLGTECTWPVVNAASDEQQILQQLHALGDQTESDIRRFRHTLLGGVMRVLPVWFMCILAALAYAAAVYALPRYFGFPVRLQAATFCLVGVVILILGTYFIARRMWRPLAISMAKNLDLARQWHSMAVVQAEARKEAESRTAVGHYEDTLQQLEAHWSQAQAEAEQLRLRLPQELDARLERAQGKNAELLRRAEEILSSAHEARIATIRSGSAALEDQQSRTAQSKRQILNDSLQVSLTNLEAQWQQTVEPLWAELGDLSRAATEHLQDWNDPTWRQWQPARAFPRAIPVGRLHVHLEELTGVKFEGRQLKWPGPIQFSVPLLLVYPELGSLLVETGSVGAEAAVGAINATVFRLLASAPPGRVNFTLFDPAGLGQNFAGLMHLSDFEVDQINSRIWTQGSQLEEKLAELNEHMEKVIQMYLRNEYATLADFNAHAGSLAEKYHFLVIAGFPVNFTQTAGRRLLNIAASGARCGVYILMQWDRRRDLPHDFLPDELRKHALRITAESNAFVLPGLPARGVKLELAAPPTGSWATEFLRQVGESTRAAGRVELDFREVAPGPTERWKESAGEEFRVAIGRSGATKLQELALGKGTRQHALVSGKTGSGKSTLFHVIITNTALTYSPDEVEFYLVDFKKGVEFKCYASQRLPHARVVAIESDREFGLSVLQRLDEELRRRGELYRKAGVQDLPGYRHTTKATLPRILLLIDEFQEFFTEEDRISQGAAVLLDRIVRQGRAFGIHVVLGSQTLGGAYTLARATIGQMVVRIALQCTEADAFLIMDENNPAPRLLSRPGEGIYNDMAGALEANSPFQTAWLPDHVRDQLLSEVRTHADRNWAHRPTPVIFEGNAPADPNENAELVAALAQRPKQPAAAPRIWLGAPNAIKGPTAAVLERQSGANLIVVGQGETAALAAPGLALISLAAQYPAAAARLILIDNAPPESTQRGFWDRLIAGLPVPVERPNRAELPDLMRCLADELQQRTGDESLEKAPATFLIVNQLQEIKALRQEDEFSLDPDAAQSAAAAFSALLNDGPAKGFHAIVTVDTYGNVARCLGRKLLGQFQWRLLFQMSASDSASLIDEPEASRLGLHRALLFNEREGYIEKFRPYALMEHLPQLLSRPS